MSTKEDYKSVVFSGCAIEYKNVSLCDLRHFLPQYRGRANGVCKYTRIIKRRCTVSYFIVLMMQLIRLLN